MIHFEMKDNALLSGVMLVDPMKPMFRVELIDDWTPKIHLKLSDILAFINRFKETKLQQIENNCCLFSYDGVYVNIPYESDSGAESVLARYKTCKGAAHCLLQYTYWLYSTKKNTNPALDAPTFEKYITIRKQPLANYYAYFSNVGSFSNSVGFMTQQNELIVPNEEIKKRLLYGLKMYGKRHSDKLARYHVRKTVEKLYEDIADFDKNDKTIIVKGTKTLAEKLLRRVEEHKLHDSVQLNRPALYFFRNDSMGPSVIWLAKNTNSVKEALAIFKKNRVRRGKNKNIQLYSYTNAANISFVKNIPCAYDIKILVYKNNDAKLHTVLLPLPK